MEQKPHKKEELMVANNVLKLAECLLKVIKIVIMFWLRYKENIFQLRSLIWSPASCAGSFKI